MGWIDKAVSHAAAECTAFGRLRSGSTRLFRAARRIVDGSIAAVCSVPQPRICRGPATPSFGTTSGSCEEMLRLKSEAAEWGVHVVTHWYVLC